MESRNYAAKLKNKEAVNKFRQGGKHIRDVLRKRCRERMDEKRQELFNTRRLGVSDQDTSFNNSFADILRKEFSDLSMLVGNQNNQKSWELNGDVLPQDANTTDIEDETLGEHQFMLQRYEEMHQLDDEFMNKFIAEMFKDEVICPICQMASIEESPKGLSCQGCKMNLPPKLSIRQLAIVIEQQLNAHNNSCSEQASFAIIPENDNLSLYLICDTCANFALII